MKFSIVIPVYNVEKYVRECVESVLRQTFQDYEIILVDDGSTDDSPAICDELSRKERTVRCLHQANLGLSGARNAGLSEASGDYVIFIDSDDYLLDDQVLQEINTKTTSYPDVVQYGFKKVYESDGSWGEDVVPQFDSGVSTSEMLKSVLANESYISTAWTKAVKTSLLKEKNIFFRVGMISEDNDWYMNLLCHAERFECLSKACVAYRQRSGSISHTAKLNSLTDNIWILETWPQRFEERVRDEELRNVLMSVLAYYYPNLLILYTRYPRRVARPYKKRIKVLSYLQDYARTSVTHHMNVR